MKTLFGYTDKITVRPGETIDFKVSADSDQPYTADLVRVINGDAYSSAANFQIEELPSEFAGSYTALQKEVPRGSYAKIPDLPSLDDKCPFLLKLWVYATTPGKGVQYLVSRWDKATESGWALIIDNAGCLAYTQGNEACPPSTVSSGYQIPKDRWLQVTLTISPQQGKLNFAAHALEDREQQTNPIKPYFSHHQIASAAHQQKGALTLGAGLLPPNDIPYACFNGRISRVSICEGYFDEAELVGRISQHAENSLHKETIANWDFSIGIGTTTLYDVSPNKCHGELVNLPLRAVKGPFWDGSEYCWRHKPEHYDAVHFHDDDLYDCCWETDFTFTVPKTMRSGIYSARLRQGNNEEYIAFFVAAPKGKPQSNVALMLPTCNYLAYANENLRDDMAEKMASLFGDIEVDELKPHLMQQIVADPEYHASMANNTKFGKSLYQLHTDGSPIHFSSWLRPILNMKPKSNLWSLSADTLIAAFLEEKKIDFDIITDDLLHSEGTNLLKQYRVIITGNHPEYPSTQMLDAMEQYQAEGGRFVYLGGNGFYWRSAFHKTLPGVIEIRRCRGGTCAWESEVGEYYHEFTGEHGGIWKDLGRPPQQLFGVGFISQGFQKSSGYRLQADAQDERATFIMQGITDELIGDFGCMGGGAAGEEIDRVDYNLGTPRHTLVIAKSEPHTPDYLMVKEEMAASMPPEITSQNVYSNVVFFETEAGGAVFSVGSMTWCGSLSHNGYDNNIAKMTENVLNRFCSPEPFFIPNVSK